MQRNLQAPFANVLRVPEQIQESCKTRLSFNARSQRSEKIRQTSTPGSIIDCFKSNDGSQTSMRFMSLTSRLSLRIVKAI